MQKKNRSNSHIWTVHEKIEKRCEKCSELFRNNFLFWQHLWKCRPKIQNVICSYPHCIKNILNYPRFQKQTNTWAVEDTEPLNIEYQENDVCKRICKLYLTIIINILHGSN